MHPWAEEYSEKDTSWLPSVLPDRHQGNVLNETTMSSFHALCK
jgi:hypothetical protein